MQTPQNSFETFFGRAGYFQQALYALDVLNSAILIHLMLRPTRGFCHKIPEWNNLSGAK